VDGCIERELKGRLKADTGDGVLGVPNLETMARAAGLLGEDQRVTHSKAFKTAKKSLGIRSVRNGFGSAGAWHWLLEKQPAPLIAEPSSVTAPPIPTSWLEGVARLHRPPTDIPRTDGASFWATATISWPPAKPGQSALPRQAGML